VPFPRSKKRDVRKLQAYITSLDYLNQEASREGLDAVAGILKESISSIKARLEKNDFEPVSAQLQQERLIQIIKMLLNLTATLVRDSHQLEIFVGKLSDSLSSTLSKADHQ
jgi:hypothetical protein